MLSLIGQARATTYATWIMVWYGHDQAWWNANAPDGLKNQVKGQWKTLDWADNSLVEVYLDGIKEAGIGVVIADLTNGWNWLDARCRFIQSLCARKGLKFCIAENSAGSTTTFENHAADVWKNFAGPEAPNHEVYFVCHGKPLIVCYAVRAWFNSYQKSESPFRSRFSLAWASGEDSGINKWGWQLEPRVGSVPSADAMFVTPSVRWNPTDGAMWRKSLAWLDYNFALAKQNNPAYIIFGLYDDPTERNSWLVSDTSYCEPGRQMRDKTGALSTSAYYDRVREWISGKPGVVPGGLVRDGAYRLFNRGHSKSLGIVKAGNLNQGAPGLVLGACAPEKALLGLFWFYHLGANHYKIIAVQSGLALDAADGRVEQNWENTDSRQRWTLTHTPDGYFRFVNDNTAKALALDVGADGTPVMLNSPTAGQDQQWRLEPVVIL